MDAVADRDLKKEIDYTYANEKLDEMRQQSLQVLHVRYLQSKSI
jgi:hypothetical protein